MIKELILTIIIEYLVFLWFIKKDYLNLFLYSLIINSITLPAGTYLIWHGWSFFVVEMGIFIAETILIKFLLKQRWREALKISLAANGITSLLSFLI